ncbi:MAG TPA: AIR synthase-related protein, partial [Bacteroidales bacterium]|nr:AIR synthase-related protein [Bacteroidales bacterium]
EPVFPTPTIGMLGILEDKTTQTGLAFTRKGDAIFLIGDVMNDIASSEYLYSYHQVKNSPPPAFDLDTEFKLLQVISQLTQSRLVESLHDVSDGGLYIALLESAMPNKLGFDITTAAEVRRDAFLFGEAQGRVIASVAPQNVQGFIDVLVEMDFPFTSLGHVTKGEIRIDDLPFGFVNDAKKLYDEAIEKLVEA